MSPSQLVIIKAEVEWETQTVFTLFYFPWWRAVPGWVIDEEGADRCLAWEHRVRHQVRDEVTVGDVEDDLTFFNVIDKHIWWAIFITCKTENMRMKMTGGWQLYWGWYNRTYGHNNNSYNFGAWFNSPNPLQRDLRTMVIVIVFFCLQVRLSYKLYLSYHPDLLQDSLIHHDMASCVCIVTLSSWK